MSVYRRTAAFKQYCEMTCNLRKRPNHNRVWCHTVRSFTQSIATNMKDCIILPLISPTAPIEASLLCHIRGLEARLPPPAPRRSLFISLTGCKRHTAPFCTTSLPIISYTGWPQGTNLSQLPCAAISTVDHPLGSTSLYTGS